MTLPHFLQTTPLWERLWHYFGKIWASSSLDILFVPRYLTCKLGLATGRIPQGFMDPYLLPSVLTATGIRLILSLCFSLHCSCFRYILFGFFRYMPLKSTLFRNIIFPKSYEFAHLPANQVCPEKYPKKHLYRDLKWVIWSLRFLFSIFRGFWFQTNSSIMN